MYLINYMVNKLIRCRYDFLAKSAVTACKQESRICAVTTFLRFTVNQKCRYATEMIEYVLCWFISRISTIFVLFMNINLFRL